MSVTLLLPLTLALLDVLLVERGPPRLRRSARERAGGGRRDRDALADRAQGARAARRLDPLRRPRRAARRRRATAPAPARRRSSCAAGGRRVALACDRLIGESEVVVKALGPLLGSVSGYLGAAILGDGRVALLLDPASATSTRAAGRRPQPVAARCRAEPGVSRTLLVVEDSFMVRELQRSILEAAGYRVVTAKHGARGARAAGRAQRDRARRHRRRHAGDGRSGADRGDPGAAATGSRCPIIVVSSRASDEDRRRGVEAGADAYMVKDSFDQHALLDTVARMVGV